MASEVLQLKGVGTEGYNLMVATEGLHKEIIHILANTLINRSQAFFMLCFQNESIN